MRYKWTLLAMLWGIVFFNYADRQALAAVIPLLRDAWHLTPVQEGMLGVVLQFFIREPERTTAAARPPRSREAIKAIFATPSAIALLLAFVCANAVAAVLLFWMPTYVHDHFKQNLAFAGFTASFFAQGGSFAGAMVGGWSADAAARRHSGGRMLVQRTALLLGVPFVILAGATTSLAVVI